ncbi:unnamed protein product [Rotaria socialis]|uniref:Uncharacterized protein n=1 Tax=Rotaria socialis TaxID=392032 RepID=A0A820W0L2_9BILA|nr:unnamed protein product [Rotaria socialis]
MKPTALKQNVPIGSMAIPNLEIDVAKKLPRLRHLTLGKSNFGEINRILSQVPQLRSLNVSLQGDASHIHHLSFCSQLNRLALKIDGNITIENLH